MKETADIVTLTTIYARFNSAWICLKQAENVTKNQVGTYTNKYFSQLLNLSQTHMNSDIVK